MKLCRLGSSAPMLPTVEKLNSQQECLLSFGQVQPFVLEYDAKLFSPARPNIDPSDQRTHSHNSHAITFSSTWYPDAVELASPNASDPYRDAELDMWLD